jgi:hypothetical protein
MLGRMCCLPVTHFGDISAQAIVKLINPAV